MKPVIIQLLKLFLAFCVLCPVYAQAESKRMWPIITFICDKAKNEVKIKNEVMWGKAGQDFKFSEGRGTYNPWELVNVITHRKRTLVSVKAELNLNCQLGKFKYTFVVKPKIFNPDFNGKCGDILSVKVSIYKGSAVLIEDKDMQKFCRGNSPIIKGLKVKGTTGKVKVYEVPRSRFY